MAVVAGNVGGEGWPIVGRRLGRRLAAAERKQMKGKQKQECGQRSTGRRGRVADSSEVLGGGVLWCCRRCCVTVVVLGDRGLAVEV